MKKNSRKDFLNIRYQTGEPIPFRQTRLESQQLVVSYAISPDSDLDRLFINHAPGSGKTNASLKAAMHYLKLFRLFPDQSYTVIILGFQRTTFIQEIMTRPDLGYISEIEYNNLESMRRNIQSSADDEKYNRYYNYIKNKITNIVFYGYQELFNMLFIGDAASRVVNEDTLNLFKKCFIICDEIHNVYNSIETNNYGEAIKYILDWHLDLQLSNKFLKILFMSATPINNNPTEIVDVLNLVIPRAKYTTSDFFSKNGLLLPGALDKIKKITKGYFSFYVNNDIRFFPKWEFEGESIEVDFLKFILCPITSVHLPIYQKLEALPIDSFGVVDGVFPISPDSYGYKSYELEALGQSDEKWRAQMGISVANGTIGGSILNIKNIKKYSAKYYQMMSDLLDVTRNDGGKVIITHEYVNGTGIKLIEQILLANGFIPETGLPSATTICSICGIVNDNHDDKHEFRPARYVLAIGEIDKKVLKSSIAKFNSIENLTGHNLKVLLGSEVIREGMNFLAVENFWIMHCPPSVSSFIQLIARPVRKNSHILLPSERRRVKFRIYITSTPKNVTNFEVQRYSVKMKNYAVIREIERALHENSIDNHIYYDVIAKSFVKKNEIGFLPFSRKKSKYSELGVRVLPVEKQSFEVEEMRLLIISYFYKSPVWNYNDLWKAVRNPVFVRYVDTTQFTEDNFILALGDLVYGDLRIIINSEVYTIVEAHDYFTLYPIVVSCEPNLLGCDKRSYDGVPIITPTSWIDLPHKTEILMLDITDPLINLNTNYEEMKDKFYKKYYNADILTIPKTTEVYGNAFHERLIEESITYIFNILTLNGDRSEYHELYFKMVNFYSKIDLIIYANAVPSEYSKFYVKYITGESNTNTMLMPKTDTSSLSSFEMSEIEKFIKKRQKKVPSNILPVGHILTKNRIQRFYTPQGWFNGNITEIVDNAVENDIIIGFYERTEDSIEFKFKLRTPIHLMKMEVDTRLQEKGVVCETRNKKYLEAIAKKLNITQFGTNFNICETIKQDLLHRELKDRNKFRKGLITKRTRWCYLQTEIMKN